MSEDAKFEDGGEAPLNLGALDSADLEVVSTLAQDAVFSISDVTWRAGERRFALLVNRFRWEDREAAETRGRAVERVRALLVFDNVLGVAAQGVNQSEADLVLSLMSVAFEAGDDGTGEVILTLSGDGAVRLSVEALDVTLKDVTQPYAAPSRKVPDHPA